MNKSDNATTTEEFKELQSYILGRFIDGLPKGLVRSFSKLEPDPVDYVSNGFQSRFRNFGAFAYRDYRFVPDNSLNGRFNAKKDFHARYKDKPIAPIDPQLIADEDIQKMLAKMIVSVPVRNPEDYSYGVNLVRVIADDNHMGSPAPGLHQDGYDYSCHINVSRKNVSGGDSVIARTKSPSSILVEWRLQANEFVFFNDRSVYHTATPITPKIGGHKTYRDMIIVDFAANPK
jgi:hypothetical protein